MQHAHTHAAPDAAPSGKARRAADRAAMGVSSLCLAHCLALPLLLTVSPALSHWLPLASHDVHLWLLALALPLALIGLGLGYKRHGVVSVLLRGGAGVTVMGLGVSHLLPLGFDTAATIVGVSLVLWAHISNWQHCSPDDGCEHH